MRTTVTFEPDVAARLKQRLAENQETLKELVNQAMRNLLNAPQEKRKEKRFRVEPHDFGFRPGIDLNKMNQLADELEDQQIIRKLRLRK
jgi:Ni,Fe-hydrogenase III large subunit